MRRLTSPRATRHAALASGLPAAAGHWRTAMLGAATGALLMAVLHAPAQWLAWALASASAGRVQLQQARGTVWDGSALLTLSAGEGGLGAQSLPTRLHWRLRAQWQHTWPGVSVALTSACCTPAGPLVWQAQWHQGAAQWDMPDQQTVWPLAILSGLGAPWNTLQAQGQLQWQTQGLRGRWQDGQWHWTGRAQWEASGVGSRLSALRPMGHYRLVLTGEPSGTPRPSLTLSTLSGPLLLSAQSAWQGDALRLSGEAWAEPGFEGALSNLLNIIGRRSGARSLFSLG